MSAVDILNLTPHKVSRDLSGYITYIYGPPKTRQTGLFIGNYKANITVKTGTLSYIDNNKGIRAEVKR